MIQLAVFIFDGIPEIVNSKVIRIFYFCLTVQSKDDQIQVIGNLKNISMASSKLLLAAKSLSVDPGAANAKNLLAVAARCDNTQKTSIGSLLFIFEINRSVLHTVLLKSAMDLVQNCLKMSSF